MSAITPCLWFDDDLEEAVEFWTSVFPDSEVHQVTRFPGAPGEPARVMVAEWSVNGQRFKGINGGPDHAGFTETVSFAVDCADQAEVDRYWDALTADGGQESMCGWLKDRFGLSWQIVPVRLYELMTDPDPARAQATAGAMLQMQRLVVADLEAAADAAGQSRSPGTTSVNRL
jgi:predicted 3-demethylubiquinone-9 3-methyltransferase (glyoxalase superfamily)